MRRNNKTLNCILNNGSYYRRKEEPSKGRSGRKQAVRRFCLALLLLSGLILLPDFSMAQVNDTIQAVSALKKLSLEELMNIEVTSVSMRPEKLTEVASAVQVISGEEMRRSGVTRLPEALRLASNVQVAQANSHDWAITARGFNGLPSAGGILANKLLVMIDGRSVYNPLFGGVYWDVQNAMLSNIDHIEVVSGPGGTLWGANAVNGVINIISKSARETQGVFASATGGSLLQDQVEVRYGFRLDSTIFCRVYGQRFDQKNTTMASGKSALDAWNMTQGGFRMDYYPSKKSTLSLQGDLYSGVENSLAKVNNTNGQNAVAHFTHLFSNESDIHVKVYFDRTWRTTPNSAKPFFYELNTYDIDVQHRFPIGSRQSILWGGAYRLQQDKTAGSFIPKNRDMPLLSCFVQDEITLAPERLKMTIGSKFFNNVFSGFEVQPSARLALTPNKKHTIWSSVSRAVRIPSRFDSDITVTPVKFRSEKVIAYELGYRTRPVDQLLLSFSTFYNKYNDLRSLDSTSNTQFPIILANSQAAESWGLEFSATFQVNGAWRLRGGYTHFEKHIYPVSTKVLPVSVAFEGVDSKNQFMLQSILDLPGTIQLDLVSRYIDALPAIAANIPGVPAYFTFDIRLARQLNPFEISLVGQNLLEDEHAETGSSKIPRSFYGKLTWQF